MSGAALNKRYDRKYFDRWYRGRSPIVSEVELRRKVAMAVAIAEYFLRRRLRNVIDIGCGEAPWLTHLQAIRPRVRYTGFDPSEYAVEQFGHSRNVRHGSFGELAARGIRERFDLLVCTDVLHYLDDDEIRRGLPAAVRLMRGAAFLEMITHEDEVAGDTVRLKRRPARWYQDLFAEAGLTAVGPYIWVRSKLRANTSPLEIH